jgi:cobalt-precorrin 5A hydrolase
MGEAMKVAGLGCKSGVSLAEVLAAIDAAVAKHGADVTALATIPARQHEPALQACARHLSLPLIIPTSDDLARAETVTHSKASIEATGLASACEAAALAAIGPGSKLLGPRLIVGNVTCAIAIDKEEI